MPLNKDKEFHLPENPYKGQITEDSPRLNVNLPDNKHLRLKSILPRHGSIQTLVSLYVESILIEFEAAGITGFSPDNAERIYNIVKRYTHPSLVGKDSKPDDGGGKAVVRESRKDVADKPANAPGNVRKGKQSGGEKVK